jgi:uncharacterized protein HemX
MLIDPNTRASLYDTLSQCHDTRTGIYLLALNALVLVLLVAGIGLTLYYCYKRRPTPYEARQKMLKDQDYILSKIRHYQAEQRNLMQSPIGEGFLL